MTHNNLLNHRYRIIKDLSEGTFGKTFLAEDTQMPTAQPCVIKQLKPVNDRPEIVQLIQSRFAREAAVLESVGNSHDQIPDLLAYFETEGQFYLVQALVEGVPLSEMMQTPWSEEKVSELVTDTLKVLVHVHAKNMIHRDVKPDNIILRQQDQRPCLIDFGAVKELMNTVVTSSESLASSVVIGTLGFMSPEQAAGRPVFSSDLYSLGMTAISLLTARLPLEIPTDPLNGRLLWRQFAPGVSDRLSGILTRAIHPHPPTRFASATDMLSVLNAPQQIAPPETVEHPEFLLPPTDASTRGSTSTLVNPNAKKKLFPLQKIAVGVGALWLCVTSVVGYRTFSTVAVDASSAESLANSIDRLENKIDARPNNEKARLGLIVAYKHSGRYDEAISQIETVLKEDSTNSKAKMQRGYIQMHQGDYLAALSTFQQVMNEDKSEAAAINMLGRAYTELSDYDQALTQFRSFLATDDNPSLAYLNIANAQQYTGELQSAIETAEKALPTVEPEIVMELYSTLAGLYVEVGEQDKAADYWDKIIALTPQDANEYVVQGLSHLFLEDSDAMMTAADQALSINPNLSEAHNLKAMTHLLNEDWDQASTAVNQALTHNPSSVFALQTKAAIESRSGAPKFVEAIATTTKSLSVSPRNPYTLGQRCTLLLRSKAYEEAIPDCTKSLATKPDYFDAYQSRANAYAQSGEYTKASADFDKAIALAEERNRPKDDTLYAARSYTHSNLKEHDDAKADLTEAIAINPDQPDYYKLRGMLYLITEDKPAAQKDLRKAVAMYEEQGKQDALSTMIPLMESIGIL